MMHSVRRSLPKVQTLRYSSQVISPCCLELELELVPAVGPQSVLRGLRARYSVVATAWRGRSVHL